MENWKINYAKRPYHLEKTVCYGGRQSSYIQKIHCVINICANLSTDLNLFQPKYHIGYGQRSRFPKCKNMTCNQKALNFTKNIKRYQNIKRIILCYLPNCESENSWIAPPDWRKRNNFWVSLYHTKIHILAKKSIETKRHDTQDINTLQLWWYVPQKKITNLHGHILALTEK
jgi:hypothetical protein